MLERNDWKHCITVPSAPAVVTSLVYFVGHSVKAVRDPVIQAWRSSLPPWSKGGCHLGPIQFSAEPQMHELFGGKSKDVQGQAVDNFVLSIYSIEKRKVVIYEAKEKVK